MANFQVSDILGREGPWEIGWIRAHECTMFEINGGDGEVYGDLKLLEAKYV